MTDLRKAAERAIRQLVAYQDFTGDSRIANECGEIIEALRQALAQPDQEPVDIHCPSCLHSFSIVPVAKRQWVSLTKEERCIFVSWFADKTVNEIFNAIEAKLKEKNYD